MVSIGKKQLEICDKKHKFASLITLERDKLENFWKFSAEIISVVLSSKMNILRYGSLPRDDDLDKKELWW
jgi:hypothetical protein